MRIIDKADQDKHDVLLMCSNIAQNLRTRYESKGHGGYAIYEDDKIIIRLDTYVPNMDVWLKDEAKTCVINFQYHGIFHEFHCGLWIEHVRTLNEQAKQSKINREIKEKEQQQREHDRKFGPVNDAALFA